MNLTILRTPGFWLTAIATIIGLLVSSGVVLDGSVADQVIGWITAIIGVFGGHALQKPADVPPAA